MKEAARLEKIRGLHAALGQGEWLLSSDGDSMFVEAEGPGGDRVTLLRFDSRATFDEMELVADARRDIAFLLGLVDRAIIAMRGRDTRKAQLDRTRDYAAEAAMKCQEPAFKAYLEERHGLERPLTDERAAQKLRSLLGIASRAELNSDGQAAARWTALREKFNEWRRAG